MRAPDNPEGTKNDGAPLGTVLGHLHSSYADESLHTVTQARGRAGWDGLERTIIHPTNEWVLDKSLSFEMKDLTFLLRKRLSEQELWHRRYFQFRRSIASCSRCAMSITDS